MRELDPFFSWFLTIFGRFLMIFGRFLVDFWWFWGPWRPFWGLEGHFDPQDPEMVDFGQKPPTPFSTIFGPPNPELSKSRKLPNIGHVPRNCPKMGRVGGGPKTLVFRVFWKPRFRKSKKRPKIEKRPKILPNLHRKNEKKVTFLQKKWLFWDRAKTLHFTIFVIFWRSRENSRIFTGKNGHFLEGS